MKRNEYYLLQITAYRLPHRLIIRKEIIEYPKVWVETMLWPVGRKCGDGWKSDVGKSKFSNCKNDQQREKTWHLNMYMAICHWQSSMLSMIKMF